MINQRGTQHIVERGDPVDALGDVFLSVGLEYHDQLATGGFAVDFAAGQGFDSLLDGERVATDITHGRKAAQERGFRLPRRQQGDVDMFKWSASFCRLIFPSFWRCLRISRSISSRDGIIFPLVLKMRQILP